MVREIPLTQGMVALVDDEDYERCMQHRWFACNHGHTYYAVRNVRRGGGATYLHRFILQAPSGTQVDHRNRKGLDCQKTNLRYATSSQNIGNSKRPRPKSGYRGVTVNTGGWKARITVNRKAIYSCAHRTPEDAARRYDEMAREAFGEFARLNFPKDGEQAA